MPIGEPVFVCARVVPEARSDKYVAPIDLRDIDRSSQLGQIPIAQLERREPNALKALGVG
jgi:hypothetical protein